MWPKRIGHGRSPPTNRHGRRSCTTGRTTELTLNEIERIVIQRRPPLDQTERRAPSDWEEAHVPIPLPVVAALGE